MCKICKKQICSSCLQEKFSIEIPETGTVKTSTRNTLLEIRVSVLETRINLSEPELSNVKQQLANQPYEE